MECENKSSLILDIEAFLNELYAIETKKVVMSGRITGETVRQAAMRLNVTDQRIYQIEAKIARKFAMSQHGNKILGAISDICKNNEILAAQDLKPYFGDYYDAMIYLLKLYKDSFFYDGSMEFIK